MSQVAQVAAQPTNGQTAGQPTYAELLAKVKALEAQAAQPKNGVAFVIAEKGGVSATAIGRFPTTLYAEQWLKLIDAIEQQDLRNMLATWLSKGSILLKGGKDETAQSILARSIAMGQAMLAPVAPAASK
jgi:hypothetical protein